VTLADSRIDELRRRLERDPGSRLFAQLAEEYRKAGEHADAIRVARTGLAQHPSYPSARLTLGRALLDSGDPGGARAELEATLREAPDNILASRFLGQALEALGELGPALAQLQATLKMAPGDRQLESQIVSLQTRLRTPQAAPAAPPGQAVAAPPSSRPAPPAAARPEVTAPRPRPAVPAAPETDGDEAGPLPPTIRIKPGGPEAFWGRRAEGPPPLPPTATKPAEAIVPGLAAPPAVLPRAAERVPDASPASPSYESDVAPTLPAAQPPGFVRAEGTAPPAPPPAPPAAPPLAFGLVDEAAAPTLPPRAVAVEETVFDEEPAPAPAPEGARPLEEATSPGGTPFSSSTLAELYLRQGIVDRAVEVYRQVLAEEPGNDRARSRLAEIEKAPLPAEARAARRKALERTIAGLEALLSVLQRS
jgi:tetratricopeptide (TPR) repeat protein